LAMRHFNCGDIQMIGGRSQRTREIWKMAHFRPLGLDGWRICWTQGTDARNLVSREEKAVAVRDRPAH
jgi:hypothetical protein